MDRLPAAVIRRLQPGNRPRAAAWLLVPFLLAMLPASACRGLARAVPLAETFASREALAEAVLQKLETRDAAGLRALALTAEEFRAVVWPELPTSRPERNVPFEYAWGDLRQKSESSLRSTLAAHGGRRYELRGIEFGRETTQYETFLVHRRAELVVRDEDGAEQRLRLFGSVLERGGEYKLFSFAVD